MRIALSILLTACWLGSCTQSVRKPLPEAQTTQTNGANLISSAASTAQYPYLTENHNGQPVLLWSETTAGEKKLLYAVSTDGGHTFGKPVQVPVQPDVKLHAEGMPKVAFRSDGTVLVAYEVSRPTEQNKYAGAILFVQSSDNGSSWSSPQYLHQDTAAGTSHAFFDLVTMADGEIGAVWLDQKANFKDKGRPVKFARTQARHGFGQEITIEKTACECCRTDVTVDKQGHVHVAFRDLFDDGCRDMAHAQSADHGRSFTSAARISADEWKIDGCPHTGPSLAATTSGIACAWFTGREAMQGIYLSQQSGSGFALREPVRARALASHPQAVSPDGKAVVVVWDESVRAGDTLMKRVSLQYRKSSGEVLTSYLSEEGAEAYYPVVAKLGKEHVLVAWMQRSGGREQVVYRRVNLNLLVPMPEVASPLAVAGAGLHSHCSQ